MCLPWSTENPWGEKRDKTFDLMVSKPLLSEKLESLSRIVYLLHSRDNTLYIYIFTSTFASQKLIRTLGKPINTTVPGSVRRRLPHVQLWRRLPQHPRPAVQGHREAVQARDLNLRGRVRRRYLFN